MIELPEALTIARQMNTELRGRRIEAALRGNAPHKFAFYGRPPEEFEAILKGKAVGEVRANGGWIVADVEPGHVLLLGGGGERIVFHQSEKTLPKKHQLLLRFADGTWLTVTVQMWGFIQVLEPSELASHPHAGRKGVSPLSDDFTFDYFGRLFEANDDPARSIKFFFISQPGIWGVGNGCLQDILFRARVNPQRKVADITPQERRALYEATRETLKQMVDQGGRDSERDLYDRPGGYRRILHSKAAGQPCPVCGATVKGIRYLGGMSYYCPECQV
ncbi:MAG: DNA-formamidopyrimidine glycosylase family protein [Anaerolineae bacterium]|nr:DNA-formamidopyrimidine glycosylase family protein [Anaerolineae bacterium]